MEADHSDNTSLFQEHNKQINNANFEQQEILYCKICGKQLIYKYGSGLYCSRSCANHRIISDDQKNKISATLKSKPNQQAIINKQHAMIAYRNSPNYCSVCGKVLPYEDRKKRTCSEKCCHEAMSNGGKNKF